jgi:sporulation protein YlmC with PRC-barrel domain
MKRITATFTALSLVAMLPAAGMAQTSGSGSSTGTDRKSSTERSTTDRTTKRDRPAWSNTQGLHESSEIIGATVEGADGKNIGKVEALLIDPKDGKVSHAVVGMGGMLGVGEDKVVVPFDALKMTSHEPGKKGKIAIDRSALDQAPKYVKASERQPAASPSTTRGTDSSRSSSGSDTRSGSSSEKK